MMRVLAVLLAVLGLAAPASAKSLPLAVHHGRVIVYAEPGLEGTAEDLADRAEAAMSRISADLGGLPQPGAIEIRLVRDAKDLANVAPPGRGAPPWAVGIAYPDLGIVSIAMRRDAQVIDTGATLRHELAHLALGAALGDRAPHWLHEGFAYQHSAEWSQERFETLAGMAWVGSVIPLRELDAAFPEGELVANRAYAESYDFVGFLSRRGRWDDDSDDGDRYPFRRFLHEIGTGATPDQAAVRAYGRPLQALFAEWKDDLESRFKFAPLGLVAFAIWILCALLLVIAWWRRRRQNRRRIAQWDAEDVARRAAPAHVIAPPYVPWPGEDPFDDPDDPVDDVPRVPN